MSRVTKSAAVSEGTQWCKDRTGKAEGAKLPDAGISVKQCSEKFAQKKDCLIETRQESYGESASQSIRTTV